MLLTTPEHDKRARDETTSSTYSSQELRKLARAAAREAGYGLKNYFVRIRWQEMTLIVHPTRNGEPIFIAL